MLKLIPPGLHLKQPQLIDEPTPALSFFFFFLIFSPFLTKVFMLLNSWLSVSASYANALLLLPNHLWVQISISVLPLGKQSNGNRACLKARQGSRTPAWFCSSADRSMWDYSLGAPANVNVWGTQQYQDSSLGGEQVLLWPVAQSQLSLTKKVCPFPMVAFSQWKKKLEV